MNCKSKKGEKMAKHSKMRDEQVEEKEMCASNPKRTKTTPLNQKQHADDNDDLTSTKSGGPISVFLSDPDVLDCSICYNPLTIPVFQCVNGHVTCPSCCKNLGNKCPSCFRKIGRNRNRAIEKVIESVQVSCCYSRYGCKETVNYCKRHEHEENCKHAPCSCPFLDCLFRDTPKKLSSHVSEEHSDLVTNFCYDTVFTVTLKKEQDFLVLQEEENDTLFILSHGNTVAIRCIDPSLADGNYAYDIVFRTGSTSLKFKSFTHSTTGRYNDRLSEDYVLVPGYFYNNSCLLELDFCIRSKDASS